MLLNILLFILLGLGLFGISWFLLNKNLTKSYYLVADRKLGFFESSFSIAATWVWAPAIFISAQQAYLHGWLGLFWFTVPNIACLILFSFFAVIIKQNFPEGYTLSEYMGSIYSKRIQNVYWGTLIGLLTCAFAVQLLAGGQLLAKVTGIPFYLCTILLALIPLSYSLVFGLKSSIITDLIKMVLVLIIGLILIPWMIYAGGGIQIVFDGLAGFKGTHGNFFSNENWLLFLTFGLPITIGLLSGPFGDQSFWQRAFATQERYVKRSFITAAFIFGIVPLMMGTLGFIAAGNKFSTNNPGMINFDIISSILGPIGIGMFVTMTMLALISIIDSKMCSLSSIIGHDVAERYNLKFLESSRFSIMILTFLAILIANIPDLKILYLFMFYGTLRSATFLPTVLTLLNKRLGEVQTFYGILAAILIGLPIFAYGNFNKIPWMIVVGSLLTVLLPLLLNIKKLCAK